jgi:acyl-CoA synthetase (AMP-forming)/AMP-acid ligase II
MLLHDYLEDHASKAPDSLSSEFNSRTLTYKQANAIANQFAAALKNEGLSKGDRFTFLSKNSDEYALMYYAASKVGIVPVPLNYRLADAEWEYIINNSESKIVICRSDEFVERVNGFKANLSLVNKCISINAKVPDGWSDFYDWTQSQSDTNPQEDIKDDDAVYQMYTSGTTGRPKGVIIVQSNVIANINQTSSWLTRIPLIKNLLVAPVYHAAAAINHFGAIAKGGCNVIHEDFNPAEVAKTLSSENITNTVMVPAMIQACIYMVPDIDKMDFAKLDHISYGGSPISPEVLTKAMGVFKCDFGQGFGMTENVAVLCFLSFDDHKEALASKPNLLKSCGKPVEGGAVEIRDENEKEVPRGTIGQVCAKGPQVMQGYWKLEDATKETLAGGWLHTGDAGRMDEDGYVYIEDRIKDMIVSAGENIYSIEVESALMEHPEITDAAVIGIPDEKFGEAVKAFIVTKDGKELSQEDVIEFCKSKIASYKTPKTVDLIEIIPRNPSGKILKKVLREPFWVGKDRQVG